MLGLAARYSSRVRQVLHVKHTIWPGIESKRRSATHLGTVVRTECLSEASHVEQGSQNGKVLIIGGKKDVLIVEEELVEDATSILGLNNVRSESGDAGHELPVTKKCGDS